MPTEDRLTTVETPQEILAKVVVHLEELSGKLTDLLLQHEERLEEHRIQHAEEAWRENSQ